MSRKNEYIETTDKEIGVRLKKLRLAKGLTTQVLSGMIDVTFQQLIKYEAGTNSMKFGRIKLAAEALGVHHSMITDDNLSTMYMPTTKDRLSIEMSRVYTEINNAKIQSALVTLARTLKGVKS